MRKRNDIMWTERRHEMKKLTVILMFVVCAQVAYGLVDIEKIRTQFQTAKMYGASARQDADLKRTKESSVNYIRAVKLFSGLVSDIQTMLREGCDPQVENEIKTMLEYALYAVPVCWSEISAPEGAIPTFRRRAVDGCDAYLKFSPFNHLASDVSQLKKEIESGKLTGYKNTLRFNPETAGYNSSTDSISIDQIKEQGRKMKGQMLVFKGLYLGMQKSHAIKLLKSYGCDIGSVGLYGRDGKVETIILTRAVIDVLFKTSGVSADNFCKTFVSAYPIISELKTKTEVVPDVERQKKYLNAAERAAATRVVAVSDNEKDAFQLGEALGAQARSVANQMTKEVLVYYHENGKGFVLEIRPDNPEKFFTLKKISDVNLSNFD